MALKFKCAPWPPWPEEAGTRTTRFDIRGHSSQRIRRTLNVVETIAGEKILLKLCGL
jgi:hypothetical protein